MKTKEQVEAEIKRLEIEKKTYENAKAGSMFHEFEKEYNKIIQALEWVLNK